MTKIHNIIRSCGNHKKNIVLNTEYASILLPYFQNHHTLYNYNMNLFGNYQVMIMDQIYMNEIDVIYKKFLCSTIVIDNVSNTKDSNDTVYWTELRGRYEHYNNHYNTIFVAVNANDYANSNNAHNFYIDPRDEDSWRKLV